jgi:hypothetical protein
MADDERRCADKNKKIKKCFIGVCLRSSAAGTFSPAVLGNYRQ